VDWLVGFDDGIEIFWEMSVKLMVRRGDPLGVNLGLKCGVPRAELWPELWPEL
jgi:hypothetical protein